MKSFALLLLLSANAFAWDYMTDPMETIWNDTVRANLLALSLRAEQERNDAWLRKLGCWTESMGSQINVVCNVNGERLQWLKEPTILPEHEQLIMVPVGGLTKHEGILK